MISDKDREAFVWIWLPDETEPVVAGRLEADKGNLTAAIELYWDAVCEEAGLNEVDKNLLWKRQFLNPYSVEQ